SGHFDRGYLRSPAIAAMWRAGVKLHSRAYRSADGLFGKEHFQIRLKDGLLICPAGNVGLISVKSNKAYFRPADCRTCPLKASCTTTDRRTVQIHENEKMLMHFRKSQATRAGRRNYRERTVVEHRLGRIDAIQGSKARYKGTRKNEL